MKIYSFSVFLADVKLLCGIDPRKDQTFFLSQVPQDALRNTMFPVGTLQKLEVKRIATELGLEPIVKKRESMGICFIGKRDFGEFLDEYVSSKHGDFVNIDTGAIVGKHKGITHYTIGQKSLLDGQRTRTFIVRKLKNTLLIGAGAEHPSMMFDLFYTKLPHWIDKSPFNGNIVSNVVFRFQHRHKLRRCDLIETNNGLLVKLDEPVRAICAGQFAVFYRNDECLGSAQISATGPSIQQLKMGKEEG